MALRDAVASMDQDEEAGLGRMRDAGVAIGTVKSVYYEWLRSVGKTIELNEKCSELETNLRPATLVL